MKALVIGIDSASPYLIQKWIDKLPNIRSVFETGAHGILKSIVPPESVPAWQCFATGKNPARIGIFGFTYIGRDRQLKFGRTTPDIGCFWDICSEKGMKVGVFNVPGTYPPYPVNGFMVSGFPVPTRKVWSSPASLMDKIDSAVGGYEIDVPLTKPTEMKGGEKAYLPVVQRLHDKSLQTAKLLVEWYNPDLFVMTLQGIDLVHHDFWKYMDNPDSPYSNVLRDWYINMDNAVGELRSQVGADTNVLLLSDHGSAPVSSALYVNKYLESNGLLTVKGPVKNKGDRYTKLRRWVLKNMPPGAVASIYKITPDFVSHKLTASAAIERTLQGLIDNVDWDKT
jgi:predicted AlkP superfamily phosphohydrolase/phosphomutase